MKSSVCRRCRHRIISAFHAPRYCRSCGSESIETKSYLEWILIALIAAAVVLAFSFSVPAQTKRKSKRKPKRLPTVSEVAPPPAPVIQEKPEWAHLTGNVSKDGRIQTVYRYQTDSLASIAPHVFKFWLEALETEKKITYRSLFLFEVNCQVKEYRLTRHITYDKNGTVISDDKNSNSEFDDFTPGTLAETSFKKICVIAEN